MPVTLPYAVAHDIEIGLRMGRASLAQRVVSGQREASSICRKAVVSLDCVIDRAFMSDLNMAERERLIERARDHQDAAYYATRPVLMERLMLLTTDNAIRELRTAIERSLDQ